MRIHTTMIWAIVMMMTEMRVKLIWKSDFRWFLFLSMHLVEDKYIFR